MEKGKRAKALATLLLSGLLITGCQALTGRTVGQNIDDATITASVKSELVADRAANLVRVDVDTNNGVVALNGTVESVQQKIHAEQLARRVKGVKEVLNNLQIASR